MVSVILYRVTSSAIFPRALTVPKDYEYLTKGIHSMMTKNSNFFYDDAKRDEGYQYFLDRSDDIKQNKLARKLAGNHPLYVESLEDMLEQKGRTQRIEALTDYLKEQLGDEWYNVLYEKYGNEKTGTEIAEEQGTSPQNVNKKIRKARDRAFELLTENKEQELIDLNLTLCQLPSYLCQVPTLPFEMEMTIVTTSYMYDGKKHWHTKCEVPSYLEDTFHDCETKCPLCFDKFGKSNCRRKKDN